MKQGYSKTLKYVSLLLVLAMLITSQTFTILAFEVSEEISLFEEAQQEQIDVAQIPETEVTIEETGVAVEETEETTVASESSETLSTAESELIDEDAGRSRIIKMSTGKLDEMPKDSDIATYRLVDFEITGDDLGNDIVGGNGVLPSYNVMQPFDSAINEREQINLNTGTLEYTETLVSVPSTKGLSAALGISYDSSKSSLTYCDYKSNQIGEVNVIEYQLLYWDRSFSTSKYACKKAGIGYYTSDERAEEVWNEKDSHIIEIEDSDGNLVYEEFYVMIWSVEPRYRYSHITDEKTYEEKRYGIGSGWSFNILSVNTEDNILVLPGIGEFEFEEKETEGKTADDTELKEYVLKDYKLDDMKFSEDNTEDKWQFTSKKKLTFVSGESYYFSEDGLLLAKADRFGNEVVYTYAEFGGEKRIASITDASGKSIAVTYTETDNGITVTITTPDGAETVLYTESIDTNGNSVLKRIVYPDGEVIEFEYEVESGIVNFLNKKADEDMSAQYVLLKKVGYATGMELHYEYASDLADFCNDGQKTLYRVAKRYMLPSEDSEETMGRVCYEYSDSYTSGSSYSTALDDGIAKNEYMFNESHLCTLSNVYEGDTLKQKTVTDYAENGLPKKAVTTVYSDNKSIVTTELYEYDNYGNLVKHYSPKAEGSKKAEYLTKYDYDIKNTSNVYEGYNLPETVTYKQDANTTVLIEYGLINNDKCIGIATTSVNGTVVSEIEYTYDDYGRVVSEKAYHNLDTESNNAVVTIYNYNNDETSESYGTLASVMVKDVVDNNGNTVDITTSYTYDTMGRLLTVTDPNENVTTTEYDHRGRTTKVTNPDGSYTEYIYDVVNNITTQNHSKLDSVIYDYDSIGHIETTRYADGTIVSENFYDENGRLVAEATNRGSGAASTTYYTYDVFDRVTEKIVYDMNNVLVYRETYEYNDAYTSTLSLVIKTVHGDENAADIVTKTYINKYGETVKEDVGGVVTEYEYDYVSNPIRVYYDDTALATYTYDHAGNVTSEKNALGKTRTITYDAIGRKVSESDYKGNITNYTYDAAGRLLTMTAPFADGVNTTVKYYYDANGNVIKQQQTAQADNSAEVVWRTVEYKYDCMNRVTDITNHVSDTSKQYTHYKYDAAGNLTHVYTGMTQEWSAVLNPDTYRLVTYGYDGRGNNTAVTDAVNKTEKYTYDVLGMLTATELCDDTYFSYIYSPLGMIADSVKVGNDIVSSSTTEYTATGAVRSVTLDGATVSYTYDGLGNVLTETEGNVVKTYTYDNRGRKSGYTLTRNGGVKSTAVYTYDLLDRLTSVTEGGKTTTYTYDENGNRESQSTDGVTATYTYNNANLVTSMTNTVDTVGEPISSFVYTYYLDGNIRTKAETLGTVTSNTAYVYDGAGRLVSETKDGVAITYEYDAYNNRTKMTNAGVVTTYTYDSNNRLMTETVNGETVIYEYDDNGNMLTAGEKTYTYNARGQQTGYIESATGDFVHTFADGVCTLCGEPEVFMLGDADGNGIINFLDFLISMRYYVDMPETLPPQDLDGDGVAGRKDYLIFARELAGVGEDYLPDLFAIDELLAFADVSGDGEVGATDYLIAYATLYEKEISECLTNGISLKTSMQAADINGDGIVTEADKNIGVDYALNGSSIYPIGEEVDNTSVCEEAINNSTVTAQYAYNPSGLRKSKTVGGSTKYFVYNGSQIVFEYDDSGETLYYYGLNRTHNSNGEIYVYNAHGDTVQLVNDGVVTVTYTYDAFGNLTSQVGESDNPFLYCSEYFDEETGTYYLRARYYNPVNGRFTQQDAWAFMDAYDPLSLNLYTYCSNNPIMYVDPSGRRQAEHWSRVYVPTPKIYNREAAINYAETWYEGGYSGGRNPEYYSYKTDCANFVSQCLAAGNIRMNNSWHSYRRYKSSWNPL